MVLSGHFGGTLDDAHVGEVLDGSAHVVHVREWISADRADQLAASGHEAFSIRTEARAEAGVRQRLGTPLSEALKSDEGWRRYWSEREETETQIAGVVGAGSDPIGDLVDRLGRVTPAGICVPCGPDGEPRMLSRIMRRWPPGGVAHAHIDPPSNRMIEHLRLTRRLAVNVYLDNGAGGELLLWDHMPYGEYRRKHDAGIGGVPHKLIGPPTLAIHPRPGDLIIFDSSILHAVAPRSDGPRLTLSTFLGVSGANDPVWMFA